MRKEQLRITQYALIYLFFFSFFLVGFFLGFFLWAIIVSLSFFPTSAFCEFQPYAAPFEYEHWYGFSDREWEALDDDATLDNS